MANKHHTERVLAFYQNNPGKVIHYKGLAEALGIPESSVSASSSRLVRENGSGVEWVGAGRYRYNPGNATEATLEASPMLYEEVATLDAKKLLRDDCGNLWIATKLDLPNGA